MLKLFKIVLHNKDNDILYVEKKMSAKKIRDANPGATLHRGPDHWKGETPSKR